MSKIAIAGFGLEGRSAYRYFKAMASDITILDQKPVDKLPAGAKSLIGKTAFDNLAVYDFVVRSPGLAPSKIGSAKKITSVTNEFFANCPAKIIGVTGTKGKGTVASLITLMLEKAGFTVHLVGNIGAPALDVLAKINPTDIVVYELSSFQLWDLKRSPQIAVVLMIEPEHLDVHADVVEYTTAKANICAYQGATDCTIYLPNNKFTWQVADNGLGHKLPYGQAPGAFVQADKIIIDDLTVIDVADMKLVGFHNVQNACAAITTAWQLTHNLQAMADALREFAGLPHRLKFVESIAEVKYYDDSIATTPGSAIAAIKSFWQPKTLILGGSDKGADFTDLAAAIADQKNAVQSVILIGQMQTVIAKALSRAGVSTERIVLIEGQPSMEQIVSTAASLSAAGSIVIMSPACASFDMFESYADRGQKFVAAVKSLAAEKAKPRGSN